LRIVLNPQSEIRNPKLKEGTMLSRRMLVAVVLFAVPGPVLACSLCGGGLQTPTFREEAANPAARMIVYGTLENARVNATDLRLKQILRDDPFLKGKQTVEIPRFIPISDPKSPPRFVLFCDLFMGKLDVYRGVPIKSDAGYEYITKALKLDPRDTAANLLFFADYLEHPDREIADDAFLEFAKARDSEIGKVASKLSAAKLRTWLKNPDTPRERLTLYAFLLGACGTAEDATLLESLLQERTDRANFLYDGALTGLIALKPREGWDTALRLLSDKKAPVTLRFAVSKAMRFHYGWQPDRNRPIVLEGMRTMLAQPDLADIAIEDLRRFKLWTLTGDVLGVYGRKGYEAPIVQEAVIRYALTCKDAPSLAFVTERRKREPDLVKQIEESLRFDR
jgi:hypothetical protein